MVLTMISLAVEAVAAAEALYICKHAKVLTKSKKDSLREIMEAADAMSAVFLFFFWHFAH